MIAIFGLIILSFLESTLISVPLILLSLISKSFAVPEKSNYYYAFVFGVLLSLLTGLPIGFLSLIFILAVYLVHLASNTTLASHWLIIFPLSFCVLTLSQFIQGIFLGGTVEISKALVQAGLGVIIYFFVKIFEDRFVSQKEIRLKVGK